MYLSPRISPPPPNGFLLHNDVNSMVKHVWTSEPQVIEVISLCLNDAADALHIPSVIQPGLCRSNSSRQEHGLAARTARSRARIS